jgi:Holliday junction resolvase RusA-like endonuclease
MESKSDKNISEVDLPDGHLFHKLIIPSSPATKKNSNRIVRIKGFFKVIPSERFVKYQKFCAPFLQDLRETPIDFGVMIKIRVATEKWIIPDYTNVCQALGDILQHYKVITNDKWIHWTDGEYSNSVPLEHWFIGVEKDNPRLEIEIYRFRHPLEQSPSQIKKQSKT